MKSVARIACLLWLIFSGLGQFSAARADTVYYFNQLTHPGLIPQELLYTYQGVVNRNGPKIFIISDTYEDDWVSWTATQFNDTFVEVTDPWGSPLI